ncbi:hypothetical protein BK704_20720 [[Bacillus thuringiensis] serovar konkukian]|nr:hypothetical protein [Bacillus thuringiensis]MED1305721.1 hypothetical protein [Bacillus pacificus]OUB02674.1 hypothetical protein BK704_20720 [[Bacillus thuringiensis] serovar konkukian]
MREKIEKRIAYLKERITKQEKIAEGYSQKEAKLTKFGHYSYGYYNGAVNSKEMELMFLEGLVAEEGKEKSLA